MLEIGSPAPDFDLPTDGDGTLAAADLKGQAYVLYFYPKDDTPGCTKEAIAFQENSEAFAAAGVRIIGVSKDPVKKHDKFKVKYDFHFTLVSDEESDLCERYGVWVEKSMYGKTYMGIERATYLVGSDGLIKHIWRKVKVPGHVDAVLEAAKAL